MKKLVFLIGLLSFLLSPPAAFTQEIIGSPSLQQKQYDPVEMEAFLDGVIHTQMKDKHIAGAALSVVRDGQVIIKKGYGFADLGERKAVDPDQTLFRIGSISKLFTWISVLQLVEQGKLDLDADVNQYLDEFKVPETYPQPVTLRSIMSHTPGFEDVLLELFVKDSSDMKPMTEIFQRQMPARVRPPLQKASYSNHGTGLAAYLVEKVSGLKFEEYVEKNIYEPLQMSSSTFRQPLPGQFQDCLSKGYESKSGRLEERSFEYIPLAGAGATSTTATDMAIFMQALLQNSCIGENCLLDSSTYELMKTPVLRHAPNINASLLGFMDLSRNNVNIVGHGGDTFWFHSLMAVYPEHNTGIFLSLNSSRGAEVYMEVLDKFTERYFPQEAWLPTITLDDEYLKTFAGRYKMNRHPVSDFMKVLALVMNVNVTAENGKLKGQIPGQEIDYWLPVDSLTFRKENSSELLVFGVNDKGEPTDVYLGNLAIISLEKMRGGYSVPLNLTIIILTALLILYLLLIRPWIYFLRRNYTPRQQVKVAVPLGARVIAALCAASFLAFYITFMMGLGEGQDIVYGVTPLLKISFIFPIVAIVLVLLMGFVAFRIWQRQAGRFTSRLFYTVAVTIFAAAVWQLYFWNMIGWNY
jgi:CubicO group peptidase (beta-lactamase class C family)